MPFIQQKISVVVAQQLSHLFQTEVTIGSIDLGLLNRIIVDDVRIKDQANKDMLKVSRVSAKFYIRALLKGKISIGSAQLFGCTANLYKRHADSPTNFQFILDALASKDSTKESTPLDLRINSLIVRRGNVRYNNQWEALTPGHFNINHIALSKINANISLKALNQDSLNAHIKRLDFEERCGFTMKKLQLKLTANNEKLMLTDFHLETPGTQLKMDTIRMSYLNHKDKGYELKQFSGNLSHSYITLSDIACFVPALKSFNDPLTLGFNADGDQNHINVSEIYVRTDNKDVYLNANIILHDIQKKDSTTITALIPKLTVNSTGMHFLYKNLLPESQGVPPILSRLGNINFTGKVHKSIGRILTYGTLNCGLGTLKADFALDNTDKSYDGSVSCKEFELGKLLNDDKIGKVSFDGEVAGTDITSKYPNCKIKGDINQIQYDRYDYKEILLDAQLKNGGFDGLCKLNDENLSLLLQGSFNTAQKTPQFNLAIQVDKFRPHELHLSPKYENTDFAFNLQANFTGNNVDNMIGSIRLDSLTMTTPEEVYHAKNLEIKAEHVGKNQKRLTIDSDFLKLNLTGDYTYATLPASLSRTLEEYIPSLVKPHQRKNLHNQFNFHLELLQSDFFAKIFALKFNLNSPAIINGQLNDLTGKIKLEGYFPSFTFGGNLYESGMLVLENPSDAFSCKARVSRSMAKGSMINLVLNASAKNDQLNTELKWGNNTNVTYSGRLAAQTDFFKEQSHPAVLADIHIKPTEVIVNDTLWNIRPSEVNIRPNHISIKNFLFEHEQQHLQVNGNLTDSKEDSVVVDLRDISLEYVFDILHFHPVDFKGSATGKAYVSSALKNPAADTHLTIRDFYFENGLLGDMNIYGKWDEKEKGIFLDAHISEEGISSTDVKGIISPAKDGLDLHVKANRTNLAFLNSYVGGIFGDIKGRGTGWVRVFGPFKMINLEGDVEAEVKAKILALNTPFIIKKDSIHLRPDIMSFNNVKIYDEEGHQGTVSGTVRHNALHNMRYAFDLQSNGLLCYSTKDFNDMPFYGDVYGTGTASLVGGNSSLNVNVAMTTDPKTLFVYNAGSPDEITNQQFITFKDISPKREEDNVIVNFGQEEYLQTEKEDDSPMDIRINMLVDATPNATLKVIMDTKSGDNITCHGRGNIQATYYNKGSFRMFGDYTITQGVYKLSMQEVIRKDFNLKPGGVVTFSGNPYNADLDVQAIYTVNNVSLSDLTSAGGFTQNNVKVNCLMNLTGKLMHPVITFDLEMPMVNEEERDLIKSLISTNEEMNMQIIYLLGVGRFYTYDYSLNSSNSNQSSAAMSSFLSSTLSGQLNNMLGQVINNNNWNFGTNLSTGTNGWTDMEWENMLSGRLLNNRLLINGSFGYRENSMKNSSFVGDFDVEWLLTPSGEISLKGYNETNDRYFAKSTLTTQGIGIVFKKEFSNWKDLFFWRKKQQKQKAAEKKDTIPSVLSKDSGFIQWKPIEEKK